MHAARLSIVAPRPQTSEPPLRLIKTYGSPDLIPHVSFVAVTADVKFWFDDGARGGDITTANGRINIYTEPRSFYINLLPTDSRSGVMSYCNCVLTATLMSSESSIAKSPDRRILIAASKQPPAIVSLGMSDAATFRVRVVLQEDRFPGLTGFTGAALSPDGRHAYFASTDLARIDDPSRSAYGCIHTFERKQDGSFQDWSTTFHEPSGSLDHVAGLYCHPNGKTLFACCPKANQLVVCSRDPAAGQLNVRQILVNGSHGIRCLAGVNAVDMSPDSRFLYTVAGYEQGKGAVGVFEIRPTGAIDLLQQFLYGEPGLERFFGGHSIVVSPDGRRVYATATLLRAIACFERDPGSGRLRLLECIYESAANHIKLPDPTGLAVHPNSRFVYVACQTPGSIAIFENTSLPADATP